jgi:hypothetical protein
MLTATRLRDLLTYNPRTGVFRWKVARSAKSEGDIAGALDRRSMDRLIRVDGRLYLAGRLAWLYMKGTWPKHRINCINGDRSDIRWANLREMTFAQQQASRSVQSRLGVKGVWMTRQGKYVAEIRVAGQKIISDVLKASTKPMRRILKAAKKAFGSFATAR